MFINSFIVLFTGKYWASAFAVAKLILALSIKLQLFIAGLSDKYPGFGSDSPDPNIKLNLTLPENPNRLFAIPIFGGIVRLIILIPFAVWIYIVDSGARLGVVLSFFKVLFYKVYPDSTYEFYSGSTRLSASQLIYFSGISDKYPSFKIFWNHKWIKITLIIAALLFGLMNFKSGVEQQNQKNLPVEYENTMGQDFNNSTPPEMMCQDTGSN